MLHYMRMRAVQMSRGARTERGATAVEYGLLVVLIAAVIVGVVATLGGQISTGFTTVTDNLKGKGGNAT